MGGWEGWEGGRGGRVGGISKYVTGLGYDHTSRARLKAKNLLYINQLLHVLTCLTKVLGGGSSVVLRPV